MEGMLRSVIVGVTVYVVATVIIRKMTKKGWI